MKARVFLSVLAALSLPAGEAGSQATDEVDAAQLGERGVALESPALPGQNGFAGFHDGQGIGDFNGDGLDDIVLGIHDGESRLMVIHGRPRFTGRHTLSFDGTFPGSFVLSGMDPGVRYWIGAAGSAGDLDGDGLTELCFGHGGTAAAGGDPENGAASLVYGSPRLEGAGYLEDIGGEIRGVVFHSSDPSHRSIGASIANVGDVDGDGRDDLAIGAPASAPPGRTRGGVVFVLLETRDLPALIDLAEVGRSIPGFQVHGMQQDLASGPRGNIGSDIAPAGDFNGDGRDDFFFTATSLYPDRVYLLRGKAGFPGVIDLAEGDEAESITVFLIEGNRLSMGHRGQATGAGDVDGDGFDDILVGASKVAASFIDPAPPSVVHLFRGREDFPPLVDFDAVPDGLGTAIHGIQNYVTEDYFGAALAPAGDLDLDGVPDLLIGASRVGGTGEAYAVLGRRDLGSDLFLERGFDGLRIAGETERGALGSSISTAGDFNGDGALDIFCLAPQVSQVIFPGPSRAYVIYGIGAGGPPFSFLGLEPLWGPVRGGTEVTIRGSGFAGEVAVRFGDAAAQATLVSGTEIRAVTPPGLGPGPVDVSVAAGGRTGVRAAAFEYTPDFPEYDLERLGSEQGLVLDGRGELGLGNSVVFLDLNGDGRDDLVAGGRLDGDLAVVVVHGGPGLPATLPAFEPAPRLTLITSSRDGGSIGRVGDVDGDGIEDLGFVFSQSSERGAAPVAYILFGRRELPARLLLEAESAAGGAVRLERGGPVVRRVFSAGIATAGDITGDGIDDFAVSFPEGPADPVGGAGEILFVAGRRSWPAVHHLGSPDGFLGRIRGPGEEELLAGRLLQMGDLNGDGIGDFLADSDPSESTREETAYIIYGTRGIGLPRETDVRSYIEQGGGGVEIRVLPRNHLPGNYAIAAPGDVDGDGLSDILLGFSQAYRGNQGISFLIHGARDLPRLLEVGEDPVDPGIARVVRVLGEDLSVQAGAVGPAGDFDGDGFADFVIGAGIRPPVERIWNPGRLFLLLGGESLPETIDLARLGSLGIRIDGIVEYGVESTASNAGDLNGDGSPDFSFREADKLYVIYGLPRAHAFVRGEANGDTIVDIADAVFILGHLFRGGPAPGCLDAADTDDTGELDVTDGIHLLRHLFQGTQAPPAPYPDPGPDPTEDGLDC